MAEVRRDTKDPTAGTIDRDAQGNPTGVMKEAATGMVTRLVPPFTREQQRQGIVRLIEDFNKEGMTGAKDPGINQQKWDIYQDCRTKTSSRYACSRCGQGRATDREPTRCLPASRRCPSRRRRSATAC